MIERVGYVSRRRRVLAKVTVMGERKKWKKQFGNF